MHRERVSFVLDSDALCQATRRGQRERVAWLLEQMGLAERLDHWSTELSAGSSMEDMGSLDLLLQHMLESSALDGAGSQTPVSF